ncbi:MAG: molybdenum cofactor guanylyltransferase [Planctomycetota bacterium]
MKATAGVVLCGGRSSRMHRAKALLPWRGRTLIEQVVDVLAGVVDEVVVVASATLALPPLDARTVRDREPELGPLAGIRDGLEATVAKFAFVTATDAPFLTRRFVEQLLSFGENVVPLVAGYLQPLAAVYATKLASRAAALIAAGNRRADDLIAHGDFRIVSPDELKDIESLENLNDPQTYLATVRRDAAARAEELAPVQIEFAGRARRAAARAQAAVACGTLREVLAAIDSQLGRSQFSRDGAPVAEYRYALAEAALLEHAEVPIGPGEHLVIE